MSRRDDAGSLGGGGSIRVSECRVGNLELLVATYPLAEAAALELLSGAERNVALLACAGLKNRDIAKRRGSAERTVANQLASIFRKLGVASRAELAVLLSSAEIGTSARSRT